MNRPLSVVFALLAALALAGCGGGGGGSHGSRGTGVASIFLDAAAGTAAGPQGTVHTIQVYQSDGKLVDTKTVNLLSGTMRVDLTGLPSGTLRLHLSVTGGAQDGVVDTTFDSTAATPISVAMRQPIASVAVTPASTSLSENASETLYAAARTDDSRYVYTAPGAWTWSSSSASAGVDATGKVTGLADGNATITATQSGGSLSGAATVGVVGTTIHRGKWTVLVYMNAANTLFDAAEPNINQMESIANNPDVRFVVQWKQVKGLEGNKSPLFSGTRRYLATYDTTNLALASNSIKSTVVQDLGSGVDMGAESTLADFVTWAKAKYPADHYALVLWSHGNGWFTTRALKGPSLASRAISRDDETGSELAPWDVHDALAGTHLDILAYDACLMQGAEDLLQFADRASYLVGSEDNTPAPGLPYHLSFKPFVDTPDAAVPTLASGIASAFVGFYQNNSGVDWPLQMSVLDTSQAAGFATALDGFAGVLLSDPSDVGTLTKSVRAATAQIEPGDGYAYYDLSQIATNAIAKTSSAAIKTAASDLLTALGRVVISNGQGNLAANSHGLSIEFSDVGTYGPYASSYKKLTLSGATRWDEFLGSAKANP